MAPTLILLAIALIAGGALIHRVSRGGAATRGAVLFPAAVMVRNPDAATAITSGELILTLPSQKEGLALNPVAARCWELMDGHNSLRGIAAAIAAEYGVTRAAALTELAGLARRLRAGYYALEKAEWGVAHTHFSDLFVGSRDPGVAEVRRGDRMIIHIADAARATDGAPDPRRLRFPRLLSARRARAAFAAHVSREAELRKALAAFETGWAHSAAGRLAPAAEAFEQACALAPGWANPHYQLGYVHLRDRRYARAVERFQRAEELSPGYFKVREYLDLARKLDEGRLTFEAFHLFERATTLEPGDPDAAIALCRRALELAPGFPSARLVLGRAYARKRDYEKALTELRFALAGDPDPSTLCHVLYARGSIFLATGMAEQAVREFTKVIELNGSAGATRSAMAHLASSGAVH